MGTEIRVGREWKGTEKGKKTSYCKYEILAGINWNFFAIKHFLLQC